MKIYTEEQVKVLINALEDIKNWDEDLEDEWEDCGYRAIDALSKFSEMHEIELPSDEEIGKEMDKLPFTKHVDDGLYNDGQLIGFELGANWIKEFILNQNK